MAENYFKKLYNIDASEKIKEKNGIKYISWAAAWAGVKQEFPDATYTVYKQVFDVQETTEGKTVSRTIERPWFDDGCTGWVRTGVTVEGIEYIEELPIMDFKNKSIPAEKITSADANKSIQRSLTKACARHGFALWIYEGEDLPQELKEIEKLQAEIAEIAKKKAALSEEAKKKVGETCKEADPKANGDYRLMENLDVLKALKKSLLAIRK